MSVVSDGRTLLLLIALLLLSGCSVLDSQSHFTKEVKVGQTATLSCIIHIQGQFDVDWIDPEGTFLTLNTEVLAQDQRISVSQPYHNDWQLSITNVAPRDAGNYTCRSGPTPIISRLFELVVTVPSEITQTSGAGSYVSGSSVMLICAARGTPAPNITWYHINEHHIRVDLKVEGGTYFIEAISSHQAGAYECHASNNVLPIAMATLNVHVLFAPTVKIPYREVIQEEGRWTLLSCLIIANPTPQSYWVHNERGRVENSTTHQVFVEDTGRYRYTMRLSIHSLTRSDFGTYKCVAVNKHGRDEGTLTLEGQRSKKPSLMTSPRDTVSVAEDDAIFNCSVFNLPEDGSVTWWHRSLANETRKIFESRQTKKKKVPTATLR